MVAFTLLFLGMFNPISSYANEQAINNTQIQNNPATEVLNKSTKPITILVMGDSLSAGYGLDIEQGWVALLAKQKADNYHFVNASISGETTSGGVQRFAGLMAKHQPNIVILELGANDALRGQNLFASKRNLEQMIKQCEVDKADCKVLLLGIRLPTNYGPAYDALLQKIYSDLAAKYNLAFEPSFLKKVALEPGMMQADGLHPTAKAQPIIMKNIKALLEQLWVN